MNILLTGITGYVGKRLLPLLLDQDHFLYCCVRNKSRVADVWLNHPRVAIIEIDFLIPNPELDFPENIDAAYYLIHSMAANTGDFEQLELKAAKNFREIISKTNIKQLIYLGGISNDKQLSKHLRSRANVELELCKGPYAVTALHAGIIIGSGSASFEIIRDIVEKLPIMITPKWVLTLTQPISIRDVLKFLVGVLLNETTYNNSFDIGGKEILSYKEMLLGYAAVRNLKRKIITLPIMTPRLSSYWLYFITSTSYKLAINLVDSLKVEVIAKPNNLAELLQIEPMSYKEAIQAAFVRIRQNQFYSSWKDALSSSEFDSNFADHVDVPKYGCYKDEKKVIFSTDPERVLNAVWKIGGDTGWYYGNWLWRIRGYIDKVNGGIGLRRGRTDPVNLHPGDALDFWRVLLADRKKMRLLLFAEMKLPGEAWLEFNITPHKNQYCLIQTATFRPIGVPGRLYWWALWPIHLFLFRGLIHRIVEAGSKTPPTS